MTFSASPIASIAAITNFDMEVAVYPDEFHATVSGTVPQAVPPHFFPRR